MNILTEESIAKVLIVGIVFILLWVHGASASLVKLIVSDTGKHRECLKHAQADDPEVVTYSKTSQELETLIMNFLGNRSNPDLIDAALTNAGIVFCGQSETEKFSRFLLKQLNSAKLPKRLMPMIEQYGRLRSLKAELDTLLASQEISEEFRNNLLKARTAIERPKNDRKNESTMKKFEFGKDIQAVSVRRWRKTARQVSSGLKIQVDPHAQYENPHLVVSGRLENHSSEPQRVPLYGPTPFSVRFEEDQEQIREAHVLGRPDGEVEVIELELTIPPQSAVNFKDRLDLSLYRYKGTPTVSIHWDFGLMTDPASEGHFSITLPKPPFTGAAYYVEQEFVTEKVFAERLNQLKGQEGWYCKSLASFNGPSGGQTGWVSREGLLGKKFHVRHTQLGDNSWHEIYRQ